ncbi:hypothetical protein ACJROX_16110 [Pseudalkalibacillus sp. A8]|uniref:hypothetical protein n=1 Tax=Pseudalkalibacillus sp. A8 TaxID=3382641 RepID=UPI0038B4DB3F
MESELLNIYDDDRKLLGVATREEVHRLGYWHDTFHCWLISSNDGSIIFTYRSEVRRRRITRIYLILRLQVIFLQMRPSTTAFGN